MSAYSRRGFLLSLVVPFTVTAAACTQAPESRKVADQFIEYYYVDFSVSEAAALTTGLAKQKLDQQLKLIGNAAPEPPSGKPRVTFALESSKSDSPEEATYVYRVDAHIEDVGKRKVFVKVRNENGKWVVTQYSEEDAPPS